MAAVSRERAKIIAKIAVTNRDRPGAPELVDLHRELVALKILDYVRHVLEDGTVLSDDQRARIIAALGGPAAR